MVRLSRTLPPILALWALSMATISCNTNGTAQIRVINAIPATTSALDVDINGTKAIGNLAFDAVSPPVTGSGAAYIGINSGASTIEAFYTGQTTSPIVDSTTATFTGGDHYTVLLAGSLPTPAAFLISDNNESPTTGTVKIRVINASASSATQYPEGFDIYILPQGQSVHGLPTIQQPLILGQAGPGYVPLNYLSTPYTVWVTAHGSTQVLLSETFAQQNQQITTVVIVDQASGAGVSQSMLELVDLS